MANLLKSLSMTSSQILTSRLGAADNSLNKVNYYNCIFIPHKMTILQHIISSHSKPTLVSLAQTMLYTQVRKA